MSGIEANHGEMLATGTPTQRMRRERMALNGGNATPTSQEPKHWLIDGKVRIYVTLSSAVGALVIFYKLFATVVGFQQEIRQSLKENTAAVNNLSIVVWTIQDQADYSHLLQRHNPELDVPDAKTIVRDRIK